MCVCVYKTVCKPLSILCLDQHQLSLVYRCCARGILGCLLDAWVIDKQGTLTQSKSVNLLTAQWLPFDGKTNLQGSSMRLTLKSELSNPGSSLTQVLGSGPCGVHGDVPSCWLLPEEGCGKGASVW